MGEDHFRQMDHHLARPEAAILSVVRTTTTFEQENINELMIGQHGEQIKSLKEKIEEKNEEISRLEKAMKELEDKNKKLDIALKTRIEEITKLKSRIHKLETEKKGLEDKLRNVEGKLERVEKEVKELEKANVAHEEENASLKEHLQIISGEVESVKQDLENSRRENHNLKKRGKRPSRYASKAVFIWCQRRQANVGSSATTRFTSFSSSGGVKSATSRQDVRVCLSTVVHTNCQLQSEDHSSRLGKTPEDGGRKRNSKEEVG